MVSRQKLANAIRILSIDAVEKANSGHPECPWGWQISPKSYGMIF